MNAPIRVPALTLALPVADLWPDGRTHAQTQAYHSLRRAGIERVGDLVTWAPRDLLGLRAFGRGCLAEVERALHAHGLSLSSEQVQS